MSLSQQYPGLVLVPWYNKAEWKHVYELMYSGVRESQAEALELLKIWKIRTPILSAGVEGSLLVLSALLVDENVLSSDLVQQIHSLALLRFLNVCVANTDKQGTFTKAASDNGIPEWLIDIRHNIAHGNKSLASNSDLLQGLNFCMDWLKEKYWQDQEDKINDYFPSDNTENLFSILSTYVKIVLYTIQGVGINEFSEELLEQINTILHKQNKPKFEIGALLTYFENVINNKLKEINASQKFGEEISEILVRENGLLCVLDWSEDEGTNARKKWNNILNILHKNNHLFPIIHKLYESTFDFIDKDCKKVAAEFLNDIFKGLNNSRIIEEAIQKGSKGKKPLDADIIRKKIINENPEFENNLNFDWNPTSENDADAFCNRILQTPNKFTLTYLESVLVFNRKSKEFISQSFSIMENYLTPKLGVEFDDTTLNLASISSFIENVLKNLKVENTDAKTSSQEIDKDGWRPVKNPEIYGDLLGILPHQQSEKNPILLYL